jgi:hypothetical protein
VHLDSRHAVRDEQFAPFLVDCQTIGKESKFIFKKLCSPVGLLRGKTVTIAVYRTCTSVPEFAYIL